MEYQLMWFDDELVATAGDKRYTFDNLDSAVCYLGLMGFHYPRIIDLRSWAK